DGSDLYPAVLAQLWPQARHQLCVFHLLKDINDLILDGVRRLARAMRRRGAAGRKRQAGRPSKAQQAARAAAGPTLKEKADFILKHRFLVVKNTGDLDRRQWDDLGKMFEDQPELRTLWYFACEARGLFEKEARVQTLWKRRKALLGNDKYKGVPELAKAMGLLEAGKYNKAVAFAYSEAAEKVRTNNHVEGVNRKFRFAEKSRYKWRRQVGGSLRAAGPGALVAAGRQGLCQVRSRGQHWAGAATPRRLKGRWMTVGMSTKCPPNWAECPGSPATSCSWTACLSVG